MSFTQQVLCGVDEIYSMLWHGFYNIVITIIICYILQLLHIIYLHLPKDLNFSLFSNISLRTFRAENETSGGK